MRTDEKRKAGRPRTARDGGKRGRRTVIMSAAEWAELVLQPAERAGVSASEWVRRALRGARNRVR
jgi:hypothetical protein